MKIYKIERLDDVGYDEFDSMVVSASSEDAAKSIHPPEGDYREKSYGTWVEKEDVDTLLSVEYIGETALNKDVILSSFRAG
jgi:hypothetical protein